MESTVARRSRVLLVDDARLVREIGRDALEAAGFDVVEAEDGEAALACFRRERPDLVLLDVHMPGIDGFETCERLRQEPGGLELPILIVTGADDTVSVRRAFDAGATDFAMKPINWQLLGERIRYMIRMGWMVGELRRSRQDLAEAQRLARIGSFELDIEAGVLAASDEFRRLYDLAESKPFGLEELVGRVHPDDRQSVETAFERCLAGEASLLLDHRIGTASGERSIQLRAALVEDEYGTVILRGSAQECTERKRSEEEIRFLAYHDHLTRLGNRRLFSERLGLALTDSQRNGSLVGVLFLDLDHFKRVNDTLGHSAGDELLSGAADRLRSCVRDSDCVSRDVKAELDPTVSRFGGDEFLIALPGIGSPQMASEVAERILQSLSRPFVIEGESIVVPASIGVAISPGDGRDVDTLVRNADVAMYHAKQRGRACYEFYRGAMAAAAGVDFELETDLRKALEGELFLAYQPTVELATGRVTGFEALVRWSHPKRGVILPEQFIPIAEETGLIERLGEWVVTEACERLAVWDAAGLPEVKIAVNVSPRQLDSPEFVDRMGRVLKQHHIARGRVEFEITETSMIERPSETVAVLSALKRIGLRLSLDDFGTGYSSLSHLQGFPIDTVKIDRSFIRDLPESEDAVRLAEGVLSLCGALGLRVVAEGIETWEQLVFLRERDCQEGQGYFLRPPLGVEEATQILRTEPRLELEKSS